MYYTLNIELMYNDNNTGACLQYQYHREANVPVCAASPERRRRSDKEEEDFRRRSRHCCCPQPFPKAPVKAMLDEHQNGEQDLHALCTQMSSFPKIPKSNELVLLLYSVVLLPYGTALQMEWRLLAFGDKK